MSKDIISTIRSFLARHPKVLVYGISIAIGFAITAIVGGLDGQHAYAIPDRVIGGPLRHGY